MRTLESGGNEGGVGVEGRGGSVGQGGGEGKVEGVREKVRQ
jgi:hypothetical protein